MNWISVNDRLPDDCVDCLLGSATERFVTIGWRRHNGWEFDDDDIDFECARVITHWALLPEPPKGGG